MMLKVLGGDLVEEASHLEDEEAESEPYQVECDDCHQVGPGTFAQVGQPDDEGSQETSRNEEH